VRAVLSFVLPLSPHPSPFIPHPALVPVSLSFSRRASVLPAAGMRPAVEAEWHPRPSVHNTAEFFLRRRRDSEKCSAEHARDAGKAKMSAYAREEQCRRVSFSLAADIVERATSTEFSSGFIRRSCLFGDEKRLNVAMRRWQCPCHLPCLVNEA